MGAILHFKIEGGEAFNVMLDRFQENFHNAEPVFEAMAEYQKGIWRKQFDQEGAYTGAGMWSALKPDYGAWKQRHYPGKPILQLTGDLMASMTERPFGVDEITDEQMVIGTAVPYSAFHQRGTETMPARPMVQKPSGRDRLQFAKYLQNWIVKGSVT
ncbi:virion morphogenesis protein [Arthrobacter phage vB_ArtM-ArV1]|uniref:Virion morphogenesis protein n=1 Tax=Arthrobacter phage vB_ArtM-ArV1 TaxID=1566993 RepID=A0A0A7HE38_9CAUD|nr:tail completion or Neck1 protein [Arthrobacter phage vB_ArtM-ArV1]AIZ01700.1 virion morphogenesis protein [Arthrobacter phage vB_ArtM-ArV1]